MGKKQDAQREDLIAQLNEHAQPVQPEDSMAEAGRKVLLGEFVKILQHEAGSRTGADIESVHKMRVAIRQSRSAFRLLGVYFKRSAWKPHEQELKRIMRPLGTVRDLDVLIEDLRLFGSSLEGPQAAKLVDVIDSLDHRRSVAREDLVEVLDSKAYRRFLKAYAEFLTTPGAGAVKRDEDIVVPYQVRHVLPPTIYHHLAAVRAYEPVLNGATGPTLHALRIEFKRLRYVVSLFANVLGKDIQSFVTELKVIQDLLGRINDIEVARELITDLMEDLDGDQNAALWLYIEHLESEKPALDAQFPVVWQHFNSKTVQRKLVSAVAVL